MWLAQDELLDRQVAVKEVWPPADVTENEQAMLRERTLREARIAAQLRHPNVVTVYDVVEDGDRPWIVMELGPARSLRDIVQQDGPLTPQQAAKIGLQVLAALRAAHAIGVMHRDVKPGNVLIGTDGRVVLADFGIARTQDSPTLTTSGVVVGSPSYIAPERARGERGGTESDLWSLGAMLYSAVEGRPPYDRPGAIATLMAVVTQDPDPPRRSGPLWPVISGLLHRDPERRLKPAAVERMLRQIAEADDQRRTAPMPVPAGPDDPRGDNAGQGPPREGLQRAERTLAFHPLATEPPAPPAGTDSVPPAGAEPVPLGGAEPVPLAGAEPVPLAGAEPVPLAGADAAPRPGPASAAGVKPGPPPGAGSSPATGPGEPVADPVTQRRDLPAFPRRRSWVIAALAATLLAVVGIVLGLNVAGQPGGQVAGHAGGSSASAAGSSPAAPNVTTRPHSPAGSAAPGTGGSAAPGTGGSAAPGTGPSDAVPAGFHVYSDPTGFSIAVPDGWIVSHDGIDVYIREPAGGRFLLIDQSDHPKPDPLADWRQQEANRIGTYPDYHRIRLVAVRYPQAEKAADWEFTYDGQGGPLHVLSRNVLANSRHAYALYWATPASEWKESFHYFRVFARTFRPAPA